MAWSTATQEPSHARFYAGSSIYTPNCIDDGGETALDVFCACSEAWGVVLRGGVSGDGCVDGAAD